MRRRQCESNSLVSHEKANTKRDCAARETAFAALAACIQPVFGAWRGSLPPPLEILIALLPKCRQLLHFLRLRRRQVLLLAPVRTHVVQLPGTAVPDRDQLGITLPDRAIVVVAEVQE